MQFLYLLDIEKQLRYWPLWMVQPNKCEKEYEIQSKMQSDDICKIPGLTEDISLSESKWKYDIWSPSPEPELIEEWCEENCLSDIGNMEIKVPTEERENTIHKKELIPYSECICSDKKKRDLPPTRIHSPIHIWSWICEIIRDEEISENESKS